MKSGRRRPGHGMKLAGRGRSYLQPIRAHARFFQELKMTEPSRTASDYRSGESLQRKKDRLVEAAREVVRGIGSKVDENLQSAKAGFNKAQAAVTEQARYAADYTDQYVQENPWKSIG